ncbi:hypothetical protein ID866_4123 [Astraeus odoratus]|nr:hypothetical protein ID866_4123 [Astraeus odoratus]
MATARLIPFQAAGGTVDSALLVGETPRVKYPGGHCGGAEDDVVGEGDTIDVIIYDDEGTEVCVDDEDPLEDTGMEDVDAMEVSEKEYKGAE